MSGDVRSRAARLEEDAQRRQQRAERLADDPELQEEWIRQDHLAYAGLMAVGIVMVQPFLAAGSLDRSAAICVVAWAVAIPLLAALLMVNRHEIFRRRRTASRLVVGGRAVAMLAAAVGLVAGFWHIHWIAGAAVLASALVATGIHSAGFSKLELEGPAARPDAGSPAGSPGSEDAQGHRTSDGPDERRAELEGGPGGDQFGDQHT